MRETKFATALQFVSAAAMLAAASASVGALLGFLSGIPRSLQQDVPNSLQPAVWDPNDPNKVSATENDLEVFHGDPAFQALLQ